MFSDQLQSALQSARSEAARLRHESIRPEHLALGLLHEPRPEVSSLLPGERAPTLTAELLKGAGPGAGTERWAFDIPYSESARAAIKHTVSEARALGHDVVGCGHLLLGLLQVTGSIPRTVFESAGLTATGIRAALGAAGSRGAA